MQNPGGNFEVLRNSPVRRVTHRCAIDLDNFTLASAGASVIASTQFSGDWPAAAVINGDFTHINAGAASVAENGIGGGVWQGANLADGSGNVTEELLITLPAGAKYNRITLIFWPTNTKNGNLGAIAPKDFLIQIGDNVGPNDVGYNDDGYNTGGYSGVSYIPWADLVDKSAEIGKAATSIVSGQVTGNVNDINVFESLTVQNSPQIKISFSKLQSGGVRTRVVAVIVTLAVDITPDVMTASVTARKDYKLNHRLAAELNLTMSNTDRKYSISHVPTAAETAAGFFNASLRPMLTVRYFSGFSGTNIQMITALLDRIRPDGQNRQTMIKGRDALKMFIGRKITTNLKTNKTLEFLIEYLANLCNFPSNMMILDSSTIAVGFFSLSDQDVITEMQKLTDATGDADVFIDEFGQLQFRSYLNVISHIYSISSAASFQAGTLVNTDATTNPGQVILTKVAGNYVAEGTWTSALSPVLLGLVEYVKFDGAAQTGPSTSVDWFIRVTNDGGVTFTPWRAILPGGIMSKWNHSWNQVQIMARLRSSNVAQTPAVLSAAVHYHSRGGSAKVAASDLFAVDQKGILISLQQEMSDEVGGANYMITKATVKSKPTFLAAGAVDAWQGTVSGNPISGGNPLVVPIGVTTFNVDFGSTRYNVPQTIVMTLGSAVATATLSNNPSKPVLTITATVAGTITALKITGTPFIQTGDVTAVTLAAQSLIDKFGTREDVLANDYIDNVDLANDISKNEITQFSNPIQWIQGMAVTYFPNVQINDRHSITEKNTDLNSDFFVLAYNHTLSVSAGALRAETQLDVVELLSDPGAPHPAYWGSGGVYYFDNFKFGATGGKS